MEQERFLERLRSGKLVEGPEHCPEDYIESLKRTLIVSADTELISVPAYFRAAQDAPNLNAYISAMGIVQDEMGHAHIAYRLLRDLGVDVERLVYDRDPREFKHPYAFDVPLDSWTELVVANAFYDQAGFVLLKDIFLHTSYGPWKRALVKVNREETFHLRHGERWMSILAQDPQKREELQRAVDWMFVLTLEWFGLPDSLKRHKDQIDYGLKGKSNDQLRQEWMAATVPLCQKLGLRVPAHYDPEREEYVIDCPFPAEFDAENKRWNFEKGPITWDEVLQRWRARGPANQELVRQLQVGYRQLREALAA